MTLVFYLISLVLFMTFGFFKTDYWIIAVILTTIYVTFVFSVYITTQIKHNDPLAMRDHVGGDRERPNLDCDHEGHELQLHTHQDESIIEEHEVSILLESNFNNLEATWIKL